MEAAAEVAKTRPPLQPTGARSRYVTLPAAKVKPCAEPEARLELEEADAVCGGRTRLPRIGVAFQATKLPSYAPRCAHALLGARPAGTAMYARSLSLTRVSLAGAVSGLLPARPNARTRSPPT